MDTMKRPANTVLLIMVVALCYAYGHGLSPGSPLASTTQDPKAGQVQATTPPGTIRVRVRLVPVDVIVTDSLGRPVTNLKREDFRIFENGREQEIRHFSIQKLTPSPPTPGQRPAVRTTQTVELAPQEARTFLILLGRGRHQTPFRTVDAIIRFVRDDLLPQDRVAVFAYNRATSFTTDHAYMVRVLNRYKTLHERIESWIEIRMSGLAAIYGSKEMPESFQAEIDKIFADPEGGVSRRVVSGTAKEATSMAKDARTVAEEALIPSDNPSRNAFTQLEAEAITDLPFDEYASTFAATHQDVQNILSCIAYMRYMEGQKRLLFFTPNGLFLPRVEYDEMIASVASDSRVAIDTIQDGGLNTRPSFSETFAKTSLRIISQLTGGRAAIYEDVGRALIKVDESTLVEYLLGYYPSDDNWNGKYRQIDVRVKRPGLRVSFRHGYFARDSLVPLDREEFLAYSRITAAAAYEKDLRDVPFEARTFVDPLGPPRVRIDISIPPDKIGLISADGMRTARLRITVFYGDSKGNYLGGEWKGFQFRFPDAEYQQALQVGLSVSVYAPIKASRQILKVIVYDVESDRVGSILIKLQ
jgi:VWFA-related protein